MLWATPYWKHPQQLGICWHCSQFMLAQPRYSGPAVGLILGPASFPQITFPTEGIPRRKKIAQQIDSPETAHGACVLFPSTKCDTLPQMGPALGHTSQPPRFGGLEAGCREGYCGFSQIQTTSSHQSGDSPTPLMHASFSACTTLAKLWNDYTVPLP